MPIGSGRKPRRTFPIPRRMFSSTGYNQHMAQLETQDTEDRLGMTDAQWAQWQTYTHGYGEQGANGVDLSLIRENLRLSPTERLIKHQRALKLFREVRNAGIRAACLETGTSRAGFCCDGGI